MKVGGRPLWFVIIAGLVFFAACLGGPFCLAMLLAGTWLEVKDREIMERWTT